LGLFKEAQTSSGGSGSIAVVTEALPDGQAYSSDSGQLFAAPERPGKVVLSREQYSSNLDANECLMAESDRKSFHSGQGIRYPELQLQGPRGVGFGIETLYAV
jgi:hypothetical protein